MKLYPLKWSVWHRVWFTALAVVLSPILIPLLVGSFAIVSVLTYIDDMTNDIT